MQLSETGNKKMISSITISLDKYKYEAKPCHIQHNNVSLLKVVTKDEFINPKSFRTVIYGEYSLVVNENGYGFFINNRKVKKDLIIGKNLFVGLFEFIFANPIELKELEKKLLDQMIAISEEKEQK
jgi:hypothetical protein